MRAFFDSNVAVYALADDDEDRRLVAQRLFADHGRTRGLVLSVQVLLETYNVLTRRKRADAADALAAVRWLARYEVVAPGLQTVLQALELAALHTLSTWDALIVQAALEAGCDTLFSEDLQAGRRFGNLEVVNPFALRAHEPTPPRPVPSASPSVKPSGRRAPRR